MSDLQNITAYIDESGNHSLNTETSGVSNLFVCAAILIENEKIKFTTQKIREIQAKHFSGAELKSSGIGSQDERRLKILKALAKLPISYFATIINKSNLSKQSGFQYKRTFYKYMSRMLYEKLLQGVANLSIVCDNHGSQKFMDSFGPYLEKHILPSLYTKWDHCFADSKEEPLIQTADIIAGTLNRCFDNSINCTDYRDIFLEVLKPLELGIESWPPRIQEPSRENPQTAEEWNSLIRVICKNTVIQFIDKYSGSDDENRRMQVAALRHMQYLDQLSESYETSIHSNELVQHLKRLGFEINNERKLRQNVIGPLRDAGIIIAGDHNGYRLAMTVNDINKYLRHDRSIIEPMLARLQKAQSIIKIGTTGKLDIIGSEEFPILKELVDTFHTLRSEYSVSDLPNSDE